MRPPADRQHLWIKRQGGRHERQHLWIERQTSRLEGQLHPEAENIIENAFARISNSLHSALASTLAYSQ